MASLQFQFQFLFLVSIPLLFLSPVSTAQQLSPAENRILFQIQQQLEFPPVLQGWNNWTNFCYLPSNPSLVITCAGNHVTGLTVIGNKNSSPLSNKFSIDSFFTIVTKLSSLETLSLVSLGLWGPLPGKVNRLDSLQVLNISSNLITGEIPASISTLKNLTTLDLSNNQFNGSVPDLKGLQSLQNLDLGNNHLGPNYPSLPYNLVSITLSNNLLRLQIPPNFKKFSKLQRFDISNNKLVGPIPTSLFSLPTIQYLNLSKNQFSGEIPATISCNPKLGFVDISNNLLIGRLPICLQPSSKTRTVVSLWNCLSNASTKYQHPYAACHKEALAVKPPTKKKEEGQGQSTVKLGIVLGIIGGIVGIAGLIGLLILGLFRRSEARKAKEFKSDSFTFDKDSLRTASVISIVDSRRRPQTMRTAALGLPPYHVFSLEEMEEATNNFDTANLVGEGSQGQTYKAELRDGTIVLVRCLKLKQKHTPQLVQQHMEVISKLRHRHLVSILGHCIVTYVDHPNTASTVFVVFENVVNGSLRDHLLDWKKREVLKWPHRMGIAMGIARGIQFLHTGIQQGVYGNDLKIEHILLDETFTAKVSNYNIALPSKVGSESPLNGQDASSRTQRTENGEKDDIYAFGIILLEIISGKPMNSASEAYELKNRLEISLAESPATLREVTDPSIRGTFAYDSLKTAVEISINCLSKDLSQRPSIEDVLWHMQYSVQVQEGWGTSGNLGTTKSFN